MSLLPSEQFACDDVSPCLFEGRNSLPHSFTHHGEEPFLGAVEGESGDDRDSPQFFRGTKCGKRLLKGEHGLNADEVHPPLDQGLVPV